MQLRPAGTWPCHRRACLCQRPELLRPIARTACLISAATVPHPHCLLWLQGKDLVAGGRSVGHKHRSQAKTDNVYVNLLVKVRREPTLAACRCWCRQLSLGEAACCVPRASRSMPHFSCAALFELPTTRLPTRAVVTAR
jgi:hypothetical protein